ncbi:MAG: hypothetical protein KGO96_06980 [Elusimicrobia bacterium]|nr:hypothetical protein [Elusimicrobiota bacterium]
MNIAQLRREVKPSLELINSIKRNPIVIVADRVQDVFNLGMIYRIADNLACRKVYLCGDCVTPPNPKITRASINTDKFIEWEHKDSTLECIKNLQQENYEVVALELTDDAYDYREITGYTKPVAIVIGNEVSGIDPRVLNNCDLAIKIPMHGFNNSMNVCMALAVVGFDMIGKIKI